MQFPMGTLTLVPLHRKTLEPIVLRLELLTVGWEVFYVDPTSTQSYDLLNTYTSWRITESIICGWRLFVADNPEPGPGRFMLLPTRNLSTVLERLEGRLPYLEIETSKLRDLRGLQATAMAVLLHLLPQDL